MAFLRAIKAFGSGDFRHAFDYAFVSEEEIARGEHLDSELDKSIQDSYARGVITEEQYNAAAARLAQSATTQYFENSDLEPWAGFKEGAAEGYKNVTGGIKNALAAPFKFTFDSIPWQLWLAAGLFVAWKLGAFRKLMTR